VAEAPAGGDLSQPTRFTWLDGRTPSVRRMLIDLV
jgi:hypothetical protein